jgi:hypothetical protein
MNSRQGSRYIKNRMGEELKNKILAQNGIISETETKRTLSIYRCARCELVNPIDNKYCSTCSYPLTSQALDQIKNNEDGRIKALEEKYQNEIKSIREEMENKFQIILKSINIIRLN